MKKILTILLILFVSLLYFVCPVEPKGKYVENPNKTENQDIAEKFSETVE